MRFRVLFVGVMFLISIYPHNTCGEKENPYGTIKGEVLDGETKASIPGATILLVNTPWGTLADSEGRFLIKNVPVGDYTVKFGSIGYEPLSKTDVIVRSQRITFVHAELRVLPIQMDEVVVSGGYFHQVEDQATSAINFSAEEIRRAPGAAGDVSRIISGLPSVAKINDEQNSLIVRGGNPMENGFFIDNIEIPNVNHFPEQGSSGGPIGLLNVDLIRDVNFYTGGFSAVFGDRLSSVMELSFREGNRDEIDMQLDLNMGGLGFVAEGPMGKSKGSWLVSARRSYLDLYMEHIMGDRETAMPRYGDFQGKLIYDLTDKHQISWLNVLGIDESEITKEGALKDEDNEYGDVRTLENTTGLNWRFLWGQKGYSNTSLSHSFTQYDSRWFFTRSDSMLLDNHSQEQELRLRNVNHWRMSPSHRLEFGIEAKYLTTEYDNLYGQYNDPLGNVTPEFRMDDNISSYKLGIFASYSWMPFARLNLSPGLRVDYFSLNDHTHVSPRFSITYQISERTKLSAAAGVFYQSLPMILLSQKEAFRDLGDPVAYHIVLGSTYLLSEDTRLTIEVYHKEYDHLPLNPEQPSLFIMDQVVYQGSFLNHEQLVDKGKANASGIEVMIQKKLARNVYGMVSGSYFRSRYRDYLDIWRDRVFDNRYLGNVEGGYKPNDKWEFSLRWTYAGGAPYTPFDVEASQTLHRGVFDEERINEERLPAFHSLKIRCDRRFHFKGSNLIIYLSVWNAYGRKNTSGYTWNEIKNEQKETEQWTGGPLPMLGVEFEF